MVDPGSLKIVTRSIWTDVSVVTNQQQWLKSHTHIMQAVPNSYPTDQLSVLYLLWEKSKISVNTMTPDSALP